MPVYSPNISEENIRRLYQLSQEMGMPMTKLVNHILSIAMNELEKMDDFDETYEPTRPEEENGKQRQSLHAVR